MEINNYKIDPLDKEYLDECVNSFRLDLLHEAYMLSKKSDDEGISQKSIDEALANILRNNNVSSKRVYFKGRRVNRITLYCMWQRDFLCTKYKF